MNYSKTKIALAIATLPVAFTPTFSVAQDKVTDEIIVLGRHLSQDKANSIKSPTPIIDVPQSLSILTADQITERGISSVEDIVAYTPGVNASQGEGHRDAVVFRGVRSTADFYIDGNRDDVQYFRGLYNLEQVEILRLDFLHSWTKVLKQLLKYTENVVIDDNDEVIEIQNLLKKIESMK